MTIIALAVELSFMLHGPRGETNLSFSSLFLSTAASGISRAVLTPMIGEQFRTHDTAQILMVRLVIALMLCAALFTLLTVFLRTPSKLIQFMSAAYIGIGSIAFVMAGRNLASAFLDLNGIAHTLGTRYFFIPSCMFIFVAAMALELAFTRLRTRRSPIFAAGCLMAVFSAGIVRNFKSTPLVDLSWPLYAAQIQSWKTSVDRHEHVGPLVFPINPQPWTVILLPRVPGNR